MATEITKELCSDLEASKYQMVEWRISIYGRLIALAPMMTLNKYSLAVLIIALIILTYCYVILFFANDRSPDEWSKLAHWVIDNNLK